MTRNDVCDSLIHRAKVGDVAGDAFGRTVRGADGVHHGLGVTELARAGHHIGASLRQPNGNGCTDSAIGTGDNGELASEIDWFHG